MSAATTRHAEPDQACAEAVDLARAAAQEEAGPGEVGAHVGLEVESDRILTHLFACLSPGYVGWHWAVTVVRAARSKTVTVSESVLLPGPDSLLAPDWVPWTERVRPGDLKAGDLMPASSDDERLVPVVAISGDPGLLDWDESESWSLASALAVGRLGQPGQVVESQPAGLEAGGLEAGEGQTGDGLPAGLEAAGLEAGGLEAGEGQAGDGPPGEREAGEAEAGEAEASEAKAGEAEAGRGAATAAARGPAGTVQDVAAAPGRPARKAGRGRVPEQAAIRPARVLSAAGRDDAAVRWYTGDPGPHSPLAIAAPASCLTCGFMVRLSGPLGRVFGVCANEYAPDDGRVVSVDHGCGAHSDGPLLAAGAGGAVPTVDELGYDMLSQGATLPESVLETLDHELL